MRVELLSFATVFSAFNAFGLAIALDVFHEFSPAIVLNVLNVLNVTLRILPEH